VKPNSPWPGFIEKERPRGVDYIAAQLVPGTALGKYVLRQAFRTIPTVSLLDGFENQFGHMT
jgi:hypothetical protein